MNTEHQTITIKDIKSVCDGASIDDDLLLIDDISRAKFPFEPRQIQCQMLVLCLQGQVDYCIDTTKQTTTAGDIIIVNAGQVTDSIRMSDDCKGLAFVISEEYFHEVLAGLHELSSLFIFARTHPVFRLTERQQEGTIDYYRLIRKKVEDTDNHFRRYTVRALIQSFIYDAGNIIWTSHENDGHKSVRAEKIFMKFIQLVQNNFKVERRVNWYGRQLNITPKYLSEAIKQVSHHTPNEWIDLFVTMELRVMLKTSTKSIKEITADMHFPNQSFLGKYFKEHVGMSPTDFRRQS